MLQHLSIQNFTIIQQLDLEFESGMTVLTGETGAGKSILIDALLLALGNRSDNKAIAHNTDRCTVTVGFAIENLPLAQQWLIDHDLVADQECQLRRVLTQDGRSRGYINGQLVPLQLLRELGNILVNIHGQHEHQALLKAEQQRLLFDTYAGHLNLVKKVHQIHHLWHETQEKYNFLKTQSEQRDAKLELLKYQLKELDELALQKDELAQLDQEQRQLANAEELLSGAQTVLTLLNEQENGCALQLLNKAQVLLTGKKELDAQLTNVTDLLNNAVIQIEEAVSELNHYCEKIDLSPAHLQKVEQRLSLIHEVARKQRVSPQNLLNLHQQLREEFNKLENFGVQLEQLQEQINQLGEQYKTAAAELSKSRQQADRRLAKAIEASLQQLAMQGGRFAVNFEPLPANQFTSYGAERLEFYVSANPGQPLQPLAKIASGGELSRISLAIHVLTAKNHATPTLIFDEVDVGIGGGTAEIVGRLLRQLAASAQVLCVTHLPQVAAQGQHHFQVGKTIRGEKTTTEVCSLDKTAKISEIARMLGGVKITPQTLAHAREMLEIVE